VARYKFVLPAGIPATRYRVDLDSSTDTPAAIAAGAGGLPLIQRSLLVANPASGALPDVYGPDGASILYLKQLRYDGVVTGSPTTLNGQAPYSDPGSASGGSGLVAGILNAADTPPAPGIYLVRPSTLSLPALPTIQKKWTGDSVGGADSAFSVQAANLTSSATGPRTPRLSMVAATATTSITNWGALGSFTAWTVAFDFEMPALPPALAQILVPFTAASGTCFRLQITSGGVLQLADASATVRDSSPALSANTGYRIEAYGNTDGMTVDIYLQGTNTLVDSLTYAATGAFGANLNNVRFGCIVGVTGGFNAFFDSILVLAAAQKVGDWVTRV
jgi:hypothetical protein